MWNVADISVADVIKSSLQKKLLGKYNSILISTDSNSYGIFWTRFSILRAIPTRPNLDFGSKIEVQPKKRVRFGRTNILHKLSFLST